ncbi:S-adenosyl-L-methionine-dependent methyltransferase [Bombardia bombarda]|uniref:S-adenosyl-L-methionine-dependent methyltransferase n=1 Tax=Bombardia bombarda TaxID=252184 RepID=A0AA39XBW2_9PEZI|nr:S-adenosyl-L-methionine-dependent methyltransferase [Bombardia bombarda]
MTTTTPTSTSQYDAIGSKYNLFKALPTSAIEVVSLEAALTPYIRGEKRREGSNGAGGFRVLDLACGTGYYSRKLVQEWGASYVLGIDLSTEMVQVARQQHKHQDERKEVTNGRVGEQEFHKLGQTAAAPPKIEFRVGNAMTLGKVVVDGDNKEEGTRGFDMVVGAWLLNYAASLQELTAMFSTVATNLRLSSDGGGVFVGVTPPVVSAGEFDAYAARSNLHWGNSESNRNNAAAQYGVSVHYYEKLESGEGWRTEVTMSGAGEATRGPERNGEEQKLKGVSFRNYHLTKDVYEQAARDGGMRGLLEWRKVEEPLPEAVVAATGEEFWKEYSRAGAHLSVLVVERGD